MTRHWPPDGKIVRIRPVRSRGPWGSAEDYVPRRRRRLGSRVQATVTLGAVFAGVLGWMVWQKWPAQAVDSGPTAPIEWNAVQAVPTRTPDAADIAWEKRSADALVIASPEGARQSSAQQSVTDGDAEAGGQTGLPRASGARNDIYVYDGDTFRMGAQVVRVANIDAPETHPPRCLEEARLGLAATQKLGELLGSGAVTLSGAGHDRYGRELRLVQVNGQDVGEAMIGAGLARSYAGEKRQAWC